MDSPTSPTGAHPPEASSSASGPPHVPGGPAPIDPSTQGGSPSNGMQWIRRAWLGGHPLGGFEPDRVQVTPRRGRADLRAVAGVLAAAGGAGLVTGSFLPWLTADLTGLGLRQGSGWSNVFGNLSYGPAVAVSGAAICFLAIAGLLRLGGLLQRVIAGVAILGALGVTVAVIVDLATPGAGVGVEVEPGVPVMVASVVVSGVGWFLGAFGARSGRQVGAREPATVPISGAVGADG